MWRARRAVRRGDHVAALSGPGARSAAILCDLGMYRAATAAGRDAADPTGRGALPLALAHLGRTEEAAAIARTCRLPADARIRLSLAVARWDEQRALDLIPPSAHTERAAIALHLGDWQEAARQLGRAAEAPHANREALWAAIAAARGDRDDYRSRMDRMLGFFGLPPWPASFHPPPETRTAHAYVDAGPPLVSVIMSARNAQETIAAALASVLNQTVGSLELIVVDDASTDGTAKLAAAAMRDSRVRVLTLARHAGAYAARNAGLRAAQGRFLTFADADDVSHPERLARALRDLARRPASVAHVSRLVRLDASGAPVATRVFPLIRANASSLTVRREVVVGRLGRFEEVRAGADSEYIGRVVAAFGADRVIRSPEPLVFAGASRTSLTAAPETGLTSLAGNEQRIAYWEEWHWRHVRCRREGVSWYLPATGG